MQELNDYFKISPPTLYKSCVIKVVSNYANKTFYEQNKLMNITNLQFNVKTNTYLLEDVLKQKLRAVLLPPHIRKDLNKCAKKISCSIYDHYVFCISNDYKLPENIFIFDNDGVINNQAMILHNINIYNRDKAIEIACKLCLVDVFDKIANKTFFRTNSNCQIPFIWLSYWQSRFLNFQTTLTNLDMFSIACTECYEDALKYFWSKLSPEQKLCGFKTFISCFLMWSPSLHGHTLKYLLCTSTPLEKKQFIVKYGMQIVISLMFSLSYNCNDVIHVLKAMIEMNSLSPDQFFYICNYIQLRMWPKYVSYNERDLLFCKMWAVYENGFVREQFTPSIHGWRCLSSCLLRPLSDTKSILAYLRNSKLFQMIRNTILYSESANLFFVELFKDCRKSLKEYLTALGLEYNEINRICWSVSKNKVLGHNQHITFNF